MTLTVYISSTLDDLKEEREAVMQALRGKCLPKDSYGASETELVSSCLEDVAGCDLYIGILGLRYGYVPETGIANPDRLSITELEYGRAKTRLIFLKREDAVTVAQSDAKDAQRFRRIQAFRERAGREQRADVFGTPEELKLKVVEAFHAFVAKQPKEAAGPTPPDPETAAALASLHTRVLASDTAPTIAPQTLEAIRRHRPRNDREYRLACIARWSLPRFALDRQFTRLTLLVDRGRDAEGARWEAHETRTYSDLREVLAQTDTTAIVLLGDPGAGKSTLLRRLELDIAADALRSDDRGGAGGPLTLFASLASHRARPGATLAPPREWLAAQWAGLAPQLPPLEDMLRAGRMVLLLDALNEMPQSAELDYRTRVEQWREFVAEIARGAPGNRIVFSCRSLDYSEQLSTPEVAVPHARLQRLEPAQIEAFLTVYAPERADAIWRELRASPHLDLYRSPFYLRLLIDQVDEDGRLPAGQAALFTGFVRQALAREIDSGNPAFDAGAMLEARDRQRVIQRTWRTPRDLPERSPIIRALTAFALGLQEHRKGSESTEVRVSRDEARERLGESFGFEETLAAAVDLQILVDDLAQDEVCFVHQLMQEYFAARALAAMPAAETVQRAASPWRASEMSPRLEEAIAALGDSEPLKPAPSTGWEETFPLALQMSAAPLDLIAALMPVNLPLAARCATQPGIAMPELLRATLQRALIDRSHDPAADLRARIAAARALGELGDPRFVPRDGAHGRYLELPLVPIPRGRHRIGSDDGEADEQPVHEVELAPFALGRFAVTNAEWRCFMAAGGYDDERWWDSEDARRWQRGESTAEGPKKRLREYRERVQREPELLPELRDAGRITSQFLEAWNSYANMSEDDFESILDGWYPGGRQTAPTQWLDGDFNHPSQPVVGICWYEARAYCAWLSAQTERVYRLPTEAEWEAAARIFATDEDLDPSRANTFESHVRRTTPVGVYAAGDGPADLAGNVWDWTSSAYADYPYRGDDGRENPDGDAPRVVRGGSWFNDLVYARAAYRVDGVPVNRYNFVGFRVLCASPIP